MNKVGIYLRLSSEDKDKKDTNSESIKNQRNMLIDYINKNEDFILYDEYCDEDLSGAGTYRPEFERLIKDCENKKIDIVLCKSQSRFSRDMEIIEKYINNKFIEWNIRFISLSDNADTNNVGNKKSRQINGLVNEWFLEDISNNIRSALKIKMKQGELVSAFPPYGYIISKGKTNKLVIDPIASIIVKKIYTLYLKGFGYTAIAGKLNDEKIPSPSYYKYLNGYKLNIVSNKPINKIIWNPNAIKNILTNEVYIGNLIQGKRTTVNYKNHKIIKKDKSLWIKNDSTHKAIIDINTFTKVQSLIRNNKRTITKKGNYHIFSGVIYCNECGNIMKKKNSSLHEYLVCSNNNCINNKSIRYDNLENIILNETNKIIFKYYDEIEINKLLQNHPSKNIIQLENKINSIKQKLKTLYKDKLNNIINDELFLELFKDYEKEILFLTKLIEQNNKDKPLKSIKSFDKLNRSIINEFINSIYISKIENNYRKIIINWNV